MLSEKKVARGNRPRLPVHTCRVCTLATRQNTERLGSLSSETLSIFFLVRESVPYNYLCSTFFSNHRPSDEDTPSNRHRQAPCLETQRHRVTSALQLCRPGSRLMWACVLQPRTQKKTPMQIPLKVYCFISIFRNSVHFPFSRRHSTCCLGAATYGWQSRPQLSDAECFC